MKVGGNESATKYFQSHGGTAALASKDPKTKYTSNAATKYKDELKKRAAADAREYVKILTGSALAKIRLATQKKSLSRILFLLHPQTEPQPLQNPAMTFSRRGTSLQLNAQATHHQEPRLLRSSAALHRLFSIPVLMEMVKQGPSRRSQAPRASLPEPRHVPYPPR